MYLGVFFSIFVLLVSLFVININFLNVKYAWCNIHTCSIYYDYGNKFISRIKFNTATAVNFNITD